MQKKINIGEKAKVCIRWKVNTIPTKEEEKSMIATFAKKYNIPQKNIVIDLVTPNSVDGTLAGDVVQNPNDPQFMQELMKQYIEVNKIEGIDFDEIIKIDSQINALIDFDSYGKSKRYEIKWVKWSNFLSYGPDNYFDFRDLKGLVLLNGEPANKSGKSTFAYDLLHFLLFGKTNTNKAKTLGELFNNYLPDAKTVNVEGCVNIDGEDYIIRRTLTRSSGKKKTVNNKVEYFRVVNGFETPLMDENEEGSSSTETNKIIKEALGNESDFDLIISANAKDLDSLISLTETEKGRLLSRWIGLSVIEDKDAKAREKWNKDISVGRFSDIYNASTIENDIDSLTKDNTEFEDSIKSNLLKIDDNNEKVKGWNDLRDAALQRKVPIDESLLNIDVVTLKNRLSDITDLGKRKKSEIDFIASEIESYGDISYSEIEYKNLLTEKEQRTNRMAELRAEIKNLMSQNKALVENEYCPTCKRKLDNVDNTQQINANKEKINEHTQEGITLSNDVKTITATLEQIEGKRAKSIEKNKKELKKAALSVECSDLRDEWKTIKQQLSDIERNKEAIENNNKIDADINVYNSNIKQTNDIISNITKENESFKNSIELNKRTIAEKESILVKINNERKIEKYWKLYLQMIGKDGISKMVLRNTLPIINNELNRLLGDVTDFKVEVTMNEKNDIDFLLIRNDVVTRLAAASGLEKTQSALALRVVLGKMSKLSRPPFILLDEILGTVAKENYDDMKRLYDKIVDYYDFILHICHIDLDWHTGGTVTVIKEKNISRLK